MRYVYFFQTLFEDLLVCALQLVVPVHPDFCASAVQVLLHFLKVFVFLVDFIHPFEIDALHFSVTNLFAFYCVLHHELNQLLLEERNLLSRINKERAYLLSQLDFSLLLVSVILFRCAH